MKSTLVNMTAVLFGITLVASAGVGAVNMITAEPSAQAEQAAKVEALKVVLPPFDQTVPEALTIDDMPITVYTATKGGQVAGYAVESMTKNGFGGAITVSVGIQSDGTVNGIEFLTLAETAGLGMNAQKPEWKGQFAGKKADVFSVTKDGASSDDQINAISGATITSRAVTNAVNAAVYFVDNCLAQ